MYVQFKSFIQDCSFIQFLSYSGEITNAVITHYPVFLQKDYQAPKVKRQFRNFKRTIYAPSEHLNKLDFDTMEMDDETLVLVVLKDIRSVRIV